MEWIQAGSYMVQPTAESLPVVEITSQPGQPKDACVVYDGGEHALFFRNKEKGVILDYINPAVRSLLYSAEEVGILEASPSSDNVSPIYRVPVIHHSKKLDIQLSRKGK